MKNRTAWQPTKFVLDGRGRLRASATYNRPSRFIMDIQAEVYQDATEGHARGDLLDMGCGDVPLLRVYEPRVDSVTCVDWGDSHFAGKFLDHLYDLNRPTDLPGRSYDTILLLDVLEHIAEPAVLLGEVDRLLRPGGKLILTVPFLYPVHAQPYDFHRYTRYGLEHYLGKTSLRALELDSYGGLGEIWWDTLTKATAGVPLLGNLTYWLARGLRNSWPGKRLRRATREKFPLGYVLVAQKPEA